MTLKMQNVACWFADLLVACELNMSGEVFRATSFSPSKTVLKCWLV